MAERFTISTTTDKTATPIKLTTTVSKPAIQPTLSPTVTKPTATTFAPKASSQPARSPFTVILGGKGREGRGGFIRSPGGIVRNRYIPPSVAKPPELGVPEQSPVSPTAPQINLKKFGIIAVLGIILYKVLF